MRTLVMSVFVLGACGGGGSPKPTEPPAPTVWKDMNADQRMAYMKDVVLPETKKLFVKFDPQRYANFDCITCHGDGVVDGSYELPNDKIKPLPNSEEAFVAWVTKEPEMGKYAEFMAMELEPAMGKLLSKTVFDPKTGTGEVSCTMCHNLVDAEGKIANPPKAAEHDGHDAH
jgi:hypothetical protein